MLRTSNLVSSIDLVTGRADDLNVVWTVWLITEGIRYIGKKVETGQRLWTSHVTCDSLTAFITQQSASIEAVLPF